LKRPRFVIKTATDGKPYWILIGANNEVLCASETYESRAMCEKGIRAARRAALVARVED
jgi:uncharacterized protein YegP (UPF0339 family)